MAKKPPKVILNPDVADDEDDVPTLGIPDADGWVYLQRKRTQEQDKRGKKPEPKKRPR